MLFHLRTKKFHYHIHIVHFITRDFTHHELTQDSIDSRIFYCIALSKSLQPCLHLLYRMNITLQDLLLQRLRHFLDILDLSHIILISITPFIGGVLPLHFARHEYLELPLKLLLFL